jgi:hypothetical protein
MDVYSLFLRFSKEFEVDFPDNAEETMITVKDVRDYVRREIARQGVECSSGVVFDRLCRIMSMVLRVDSTGIKLETRFEDLLLRRSSVA